LVLVYIKVLCRQTSAVGSSRYSMVGQQEDMGVENGKECHTLRKYRVPRVAGWVKTVRRSIFLKCLIARKFKAFHFTVKQL